jgi:hypothetical protein
MRGDCRLCALFGNIAPCMHPAPQGYIASLSGDVDENSELISDM